ncbi:hypothetical protein D9757_000560 [Collybiopsis confluens]|uniref:Secreted protein n=1 Tax=Collybiopsis confluens TaxID=2823264 RepID=A0A8H5MGZ2_9AGAR|nr:hypothetical protein D9757_000560 [Collybiopsis confluens]
MAYTLLQIPAFLHSFFFVLVASKTHTVRVDNQCGYGTPQLIQGSPLPKIFLKIPWHRYAANRSFIRLVHREAIAGSIANTVE